MIQTKADLRRCLLARRAALTPAEVEQKSLRIAAHVVAMAAFCASHTVMVYMALSQEVQTSHLIQEARRQHKRIAIPMVQGSRLLAVELPQDAQQLRRGPYGILQPHWPAPVIRPEEIQCVAVPGVAFDRRGARLGFGKGYYDRFLAQLPVTTYTCGLAFGMQVVPCVPRLPHDVCMHGIVTEQGLIPCNVNAARRPGNRSGFERGKGELR